MLITHHSPPPTNETLHCMVKLNCKRTTKNLSYKAQTSKFTTLEPLQNSQRITNKNWKEIYRWRLDCQPCCIQVTMELWDTSWWGRGFVGERSWWSSIATHNLLVRKMKDEEQENSKFGRKTREWRWQGTCPFDVSNVAIRQFQQLLIEPFGNTP